MDKTIENIPEQYLKALLEISQQLNSIREPEELLRNALDIAVEQLSADRGFILLKDETGDFQPAAVHGMEKAQLDKMEDISHSTVEKVLRTGKPLLTFDALSDERFNEAQSVVLHQIRSIACVPLILKGELQGAIYIDSQGQRARFSRQSLHFLEAFANQAAVALENARLLSYFRQENALLKEEFHRIFAFRGIIGKSKAMQQVFQLMGKVLNNDTTLLITGETGTGKELIARAIHYNGLRSKKPFVPVNCGAIPESLIESELFGHKKGAFTGAISDKKGLVEMANGGTLFLDEVGELPLPLQVKLLRFLQDHEFTPVGDVRPRKADVRIIAATNRDLRQEIREGRFRQDLFYRLNVINLHLPPLRERKKDIPLLVKHFVDVYQKKLHKQIVSVTPEAMKQLEQYPWPGNVRELENTIERAVVVDADGKIDTDDLMLLEEPGAGGEIEPGMTLEEVSRILLEKTLKATDGNKTRTAEMMGVSLRWVHYKSKEWGLG